MYPVIFAFANQVLSFLHFRKILKNVRSKINNEKSPVKTGDVMV